MASRSLGTLTVDLVAKTAGFTAGLDKAARDADKRLSQIEKRAYQFGTVLGTGIRAAAIGFAAATTAITALTVQSANYADQLDEMSQRLGISTEQLSKWAYAANLSGTDIDTVARGVGLLSRNMAAAADPTSKMADLFKALGIEVKDAQGNLRATDAVLPEIADRFAALDNQTTETALAMELFGRSGAELLEFLNRGSQGIAELGDELDSLGGVVSGQTAAAAAEFKDELDRIKVATQGLGLQVAGALLPALKETAEDFRELVQEGNLAANAVTVLSTALRAGVFILEQYDNAVERASIAIEGFVNLQRGLTEIATNLGPAGLFNEGSLLGGIRKLTGGYEEAQAQLDDLVKRQNNAIKQAPEVIFAGEGSEPNGLFQRSERQLGLDKERVALQERLNKMLEGEQKSKSGGKSKAQQEAEALTRAYDSMALSLDRQIALFGETSEAAQVRYEVEYGNLVNLEPKLKQYLIYKAEELDEKKALAEQAKEDERLQKEEMKRLEEGLRIGREMTESIKFETELLGMSNRERAKAIALSQLSAEARTAEAEAISRNINELYDEMAKVELMDGFRDSFKGFFTDVLSGTESVSDAFKNMLDNIHNMILNRIAENWVDMLFGQSGTSQSGSSGGWVNMVAGLFGGGRASGGWTSPNTIYEVNERGLEMATVNGRDYMLTGNSPAYVTPHERLPSGSGDLTVNFNGFGRPDRRTAQQAAADLAAVQQSAMVRNGRGGRSG